MAAAHEPAPLLVEAAALDDLVTELSARFLEVDSSRIDDCLEEALRSVVQVLGLDRSTVSRLGEDGRSYSIVHSCAVEGFDPITGFSIDAELHPWAAARMRSGEGFHFARPEDLPEQAHDVAAWAEHERVLSHVTIPMRVGNETIGGFHAASLSRHVDLGPVLPKLRTLTRVFTAALERRRIDAELRRTIDDLEALRRRISEENVDLRQRLESQSRPRPIVGDSPALRDVMRRARKVAATDSNVLLLGETGTGKGLLAEEIHHRSARAAGPLITIDCTSLPPTLIESELFGHEKGAFSGADRQKKGRLELAHGGTLLLDEIGELPEPLQSKFLKVLETGELSRIGSTRTRRVDVRLIAATNRNLQEEVTAGRFRADLYYRIGVFPVVLPPLRERFGDIPLLTWSFVEHLQTRIGRRIRTISEPTMRSLEEYDWPGNVRELRNVIERSLILSSGDELLVEDLAATEAPAPAAAVDDLRTNERRLIERVLAASGGRIKGPGGAAERLGIKPGTLYYRLKKLGIER